jgi:hypothetical protein
MLLGRRAEAFTHPDWLFELKYDGFRALAFVENGVCRLVSRNGNTFKSFEQLALAVPRDLRTRTAVLDGEIVVLDEAGRSQFGDLFYRRREPIFVAFDLLSASGRDMEHLPLVERGGAAPRDSSGGFQHPLLLACRARRRGFVSACLRTRPRRHCRQTQVVTISHRARGDDVVQDS